MASHRSAAYGGELVTAIGEAIKYRRPALLLAVTIMLVAYNLRLAAVSIGPVLPDLQAELGISTALAGLLTSLPTLCFALFGFLGPELASRLGLHRTILAALATNAAGQALRIVAGNTVGFLIGTVLALAGIGVINVLMPALVKRHFPLRAGLMTALYSTTQAIAVAIAGLLTARLALSMDGWRGPFWIWAGCALVALVPLVITAVRFGDSFTRRVSAIRLPDVARTRLGWYMAVFFGTQSAIAYAQFGWLPSIYQEAGFTATQAGDLATIFLALVIPVTFVAPVLTQRVRNPAWLVWATAVLAAAGFIGLAWDPAQLPWLWPALMALGGGAFSMILVLLNMRARTQDGTAALSSFAQSSGYVLAAFGPLLMGVLKDSTGGWIAPLLFQAFLAVPMLLCGLAVVRSGYLEDQLPAGHPARVNEGQ